MYLDLKVLNQQDPVKRKVEKDLEEQEDSPMDPPTAYEKDVEKEIDVDSWPYILKVFVEEHEDAKSKIEEFEKCLGDLKENHYKFTNETNKVFSEFYQFFDENLMKHNEKEEKVLFQLLHNKLIEDGEHNGAENPMTAVDLMEDDHVRFIQLAALSFNLFGVAMRLHDQQSRYFVFDVAFQNAKELIELLRLHIHREDHTLFPLANKLINEEEFAALNSKIKEF